EKLFNAFGQVEHLLSVEQSGLVRYAIFVHGLGPEEQVDGGLSGYAIIEVPVEDNPLLKEIINETNTPIPEWIKNNAKWWADGEINDDAFIQGIGFLIKEGTILVESTSQSEKDSKEIPEWIKNNAKWWADGEINDDAFIQGIEFLVKAGVIPV
ncbi:MAG: peptidase, partial [Nitrosopumilus sp.]|nr:peptidase [Nitrosopumilus sp.]